MTAGAKIARASTNHQILITMICGKTFTISKMQTAVHICTSFKKCLGGLCKAV
ncbi:MAG: hypothetical protein GY809_30480 [Planctomycetes bacterium]|nr:hypothetical protein [Planctomycetota bacterium]